MPGKVGRYPAWKGQARLLAFAGATGIPSI